MNETTIEISDDALDNGLVLESVDEDMLRANTGSFNDLANEIKNVENGGTLNLNRNYEYSSGDSAIVIDKKITINGNGFKIDAKKSCNIFNCYGDEKVFNNIFFCNGYSQDNGGAIYSESKLTLNGCVFEGNWIYDGGFGAAIFSTSDVSLEGCTFKNHKLYFVDDLFLINSKSISVRNSLFFDNDCGVISFESNMNIINSQFSNNNGECLFSKSYITKDCYLKNCTFIANTGQNIDSFYSASTISLSSFASSSKIEIDDCKFINNSCIIGPHIRLIGFNGILNNCEFIGNDGLEGGGIRLALSNFTIRNSKFDSNSAKDSGGAIYTFQSELHVYSTDFINNSAKNGGAFYWDCHNSSILSCNFIGNSADNGGAIYNFNLLNNLIKNSSFIRNDAENGKSIYFCKDFMSFADEIFFVSNISDNNFDNYDDAYGGLFSFKDMVFGMLAECNDVIVYIDGQLFNHYVSPRGELAMDLSNFSSGSHNIRIIVQKGKHWEVTIPFKIDSFNIHVRDVTMEYGGSEKLEISLFKLGSPLAGVNVDITIGGVRYVRTTDSDGHISMPIDLDCGVYDVVVTYNGVSKKSSITVNQISTRVYLNAYRMFENNVYMNVTVDNASDGDKIIFKVESNYYKKEFESTIKNNNANFSMFNQDFPRVFNIDAIYSGNLNHKSSSNSSFLKFGEEIIPISCFDLNKFYGAPEDFIISIRDSQNNPVYNATLKIVIDGVDYIRTTDTNGMASLGFELNSGNYTAEVSYLNPSECNDFINSYNIIIKPTIFGNDVVGSYNDIQYSVNLTDSSGIPLSDGDMMFKINSKSYAAHISNGKAIIQINENAGSYVIESTNPVTGETISNNIVINPLVTKLSVYVNRYIRTTDPIEVFAKIISSQSYSSNVISEGYVEFKIGSQSKTVNLSGNGASCTFSSLSEGSYVVTATYYDDEGNYLSSLDSDFFFVSKVSPELSVVAEDIGGGQNAIFEVTLNTDSTGEVGVSINDNVYMNNLTGGKTIIRVPDLPIGNYTYNVTYYGDSLYRSDSIVGNISVYAVNVILKTSDLIKYYNSSESLSAQLLDNSSNPLAGEKIIFTIHGIRYERTTDDSGTAYVDVDLNVGMYIADIRYDGNAKYDPIRTKNQIEVKSTVFGDDMTKFFGNETPYSATFFDSQGKPLKNANVKFIIDGKSYESSTNRKGVANLNIILNSGLHIIELVNLRTGEICTKNIDIKPVKTVLHLNGPENVLTTDSLTLNTQLILADGFDDLDMIYSGYIVFVINSQSKTVNVSSYNSSCTFSGFSEGSYVVTATYDDDDGNYLSSSDSMSFNVSKVSPEISVTVNDVLSGQNAIFEIGLANVSSGEVYLFINYKIYRNNVTAGKTIIRVPDLPVGNYTYDIIYDGNSLYDYAVFSGNVSVYTNVILKGSDLVKYYGSSEKMSAKLTDISGKPLSGQKIIFTINGMDYGRTTDDSGFAFMNVNLNSGNYDVGVRFDGNDDYTPIDTKCHIEIRATVLADDVTKMFRNATQYYATFLDSHGNVLKNTMVRFNINGVFYNRSTNENGTARLNINLNPGTYILTAENPSTGESYSNNVTVLSSIVEAYDLTKYYRNESKYTLRILDDHGNPVGEGISVKLNINGVFYERKTNSSGYINFNINLNPGDYILTAEYNDLRVSNNIKVLPIINANDITMKYRDGTKFEAKLLDGKGNLSADKIITFNVNGIMYNRVTDSEGIARLNINLMPGKYIITSMYSNGAAISNRITIDG